MIDPETLADQLPDRPLRPEEVSSIFDRVGWSTMPVISETDSGTEYIAIIYCHDDKTKRAMALRMDDEMDTWIGEVMREGVNQSKWLEVNQQYSDMVEGEIEPVRMEFEDGKIRDFGQ